MARLRLSSLTRKSSFLSTSTSSLPILQKD
jgi:hypothetical protein